MVLLRFLYRLSVTLHRFIINLIKCYMKKVLLLALMCLLLMPMEIIATSFECDEEVYVEPPIRSLNHVNARIDAETGVFSILANYDIACLYVTIEQNNVVLDSFSQPLYNGVPATYNFASYSTGEYHLTLSSPDGMIARYRITITDD